MTLNQKGQNFHQRTLKITNTLGKIAGHKLNIQKSVAFLSSNNNQTEEKNRETINLQYSKKI
jgi:hypothetical protein